MTPYRSGFVAVLGRPNVGKSTLVNALVGRKVAIVSPRPQTTRNRIMGVRHFPGGQVVFLDTPGLHRPRDLLGKAMVRHAEAALAGADLACLVVDLSEPFGPGDRRAAEAVAAARCPVALVGSKLDLVPRAEREGRLGAAEAVVGAIVALDAAFAVSAHTGEGLAELAGWVESRLPEGPAYFPEGQVTDQPEARLLAEIVREKAFERLAAEVPYGVAVLVERMEPRPQGLVYVEATIFVERESHKGIVIGHGGAMLKAIGQAARREAEAILGTRLYLDLRVKVKADWRERAGALAELGLDD
ncbi:MAG: GTPase Era [Clostridia bacterium]|nr:GTPase Era [Clostridia bacterium]